MTHHSPLPLSIFGSCVARDTVNSWPKNSFNLKRYISRQSLISAYSQPSSADDGLPNIAMLESPFQQRMLSQDWAGSVRASVHDIAADSKALLIDLVDERLGVYEIAQNQYITNSLELIRCDPQSRVPKAFRLIPFGSDEHYALWTQALNAFSTDLHKHNLHDRTWVLQTPWAACFSDGQITQSSFGVSASDGNELFSRYYDHVAGLLQTVKLDSAISVADPNHKWGPAPFHYTEDVYKELTAKLLLQSNLSLDPVANTAEPSFVFEPIMTRNASARPPSATGSQLEFAARSMSHRSNSDDEVLAHELLASSAFILGRPVNLEQVSWSNPEASPGWLTHLNSLKWLDPLRRASTDPGDKWANKWITIVQDWLNSDASGELTTRAWRPLGVVDRVTTLCLGYDLMNASGLLVELQDMLLKHKIWISEQFASPLRRAQPVLLIPTIMLIDKLLEIPTADTQALIERLFLTQVGKDGSIRAADPDKSLDLRAQWHDALSHARAHSIPITSAEEAIDNLDCLVYSTLPNGSPVPYGSKTDERTEIDDPRLTYIMTEGQAGSAPEHLTFRPVFGLLSSRSGWGETDRRPSEETLYTVLFGPTPPDGHDDNLRITYSSDGVDWLIDPSTSDCTALPDRKLHSTVTVVGSESRNRSTATLNKWHSDAECEDHQFEDSSQVDAQFKRHIAYSRAGEYIVIIDSTIGAGPHIGRRNWIIAPDVNIEIEGSIARLSKGKSECRLTLLASSDSKLMLNVDSVYDNSGHKIAQRISSETHGATTKTVSVISKVRDLNAFSVKLLQATGPTVSLTIQDRDFSEKIVVTPERAMTSAPSEDTASVISRIEQSALYGDSDRNNQHIYRSEARTLVSSVKQKVWSENGSQQARRQAIGELADYATGNGISGLRDFGIGAAIIDLAAHDLRREMISLSSIDQQKRTPLINWSGNQMLHDFYQAPIYTHQTRLAHSGTLPSKSIQTIDLGQLVLPIHVNKQPGTTLIVMFHGATDRVRNTTPRFEGLRTTEAMHAGPVLTIADPCLDLDGSMILSWYAGTKCINLHKVIADTIKAFASEFACEKIALIGNSGGGFAALQVASYIRGSTALAFSPQIDIDKYNRRHSRTAYENLFGTENIDEDLELRARMSVIDRYKAINFEQKVFIVQNSGDGHHWNEHFMPLRAAYESSGNGQLLDYLTPDLGPGHRVPEPAEFRRIIREFLNES